MVTPTLLLQASTTEYRALHCNTCALILLKKFLFHHLLIGFAYKARRPKDVAYFPVCCHSQWQEDISGTNNAERMLFRSKQPTLVHMSGQRYLPKSIIISVLEYDTVNVALISPQPVCGVSNSIDPVCH